MKKSKRKITKKVKNKTAKMKKQKFIVVPGSPFNIWELLDQAEKDLANKKIEAFIMCGMPAKLPATVYSDIKTWANEDGLNLGRYSVAHSSDGKSVSYNRLDESSINDFRVPPITKNGAFFYKLVADLKGQQNDALKRFQTLSNGQEEVNAITVAYNQAIAKLEALLVKSGQLKFSNRECAGCRQFYIPDNSVHNVCYECEYENQSAIREGNESQPA